MQSTVLTFLPGFSGLAVARAYLELYPSRSLRILDDGGTIGGTWSKDRLYPTLRTNNMLGTFEFSDFSMQNYGIEPGQHIR